METNSILNGNEYIAKWLGWSNHYCPGSYFPPRNIFQELNLNSEVLNAEELLFHKDSNWQWLVISEIAKSYPNYSAVDILVELEHLNEDYSEPILSKLDLFNAIVTYIKNEENGLEN